MRDPLESNPAFLPAEYGMTDDPQADYERQAVAMEAGMKLQQLRQCSKVLRMTIDADDYDSDAEVFGRGYARARMWEQYAENHPGRLSDVPARGVQRPSDRTAGKPFSELIGPVRSGIHSGGFWEPGRDADAEPRYGRSRRDRRRTRPRPTALALLHEALGLAERARIPVVHAKSARAWTPCSANAVGQGASIAGSDWAAVIVDYASSLT